METNNKSFFDRMNSWMRKSVTLKLLSIGILVLLLLIPAFMVRNVIEERQSTSESAIIEVSGKWGNEQQLAGPVLVVPAMKSVTVNNRTMEETEYFYFLPEKLEVSGDIAPEKRYRGIYEVVVYSSVLNFKGHFLKPDLTEWKDERHAILWNEAFVVVGITDMRGIREQIKLNWNEKVQLFNPGTGNHDVVESGVSVKTPIDESSNTASEYQFNFSLRIDGSKELSFAPLGKETKVQLKSTWSEPSFSGAFLPEQRNVTADGFTAQWHVINLNRNYPQAWKGAAYNIKDSYFGVSLIVPVDHYLKNMRAAKYAVLIITLTFIVFFFIELLYKLRIHPFHYILVGLAICIFYSLLLAFSEHINFNFAYILSAVLVIGAISLYSRAVLKQKLPSLILLLILVLIYGFIYVIIQLQDYALLVGSLGLFFVLVTLMYLSQKVKWYRDEDVAEN